MTTVFENNISSLIHSLSTLDGVVNMLEALGFLGLGFFILFMVLHGIPKIILKHREKKYGSKPIEIVEVVDGKIEECGKDWAHLNNGKQWLKYSQVGVYHGNMSGLKKGDLVKCHIRKLSNLECWAGEPNIAKLELQFQRNESQ